jgi:hypothetical protein
VINGDGTGHVYGGNGGNGGAVCGAGGLAGITTMIGGGTQHSGTAGTSAPC